MGGDTRKSCEFMKGGESCAAVPTEAAARLAMIGAQHKQRTQGYFTAALARYLHTLQGLTRRHAGATTFALPASCCAMRAKCHIPVTAMTALTARRL